MIRNYFKLALRNLQKNRSSSIINIGGLTVGMTVALLIGLWIHNELSYNKSYRNYDRIAWLMQHQTSNGIVYTSQSMPLPLANVLQTDYKSDFKHIVLSSWFGDHILSYGDKILSKNGTYMDVGAPGLFSLDMLKGDLNGLKDPHSILLSESCAKAIFKDADPINQLMKIDNKLDVKVTGVYKDQPYNSKLSDINFIAPWNLYVTSERWLKDAYTQWDNNSFQIFVQIEDNTSFEAVNKKIINSKLDHTTPEDKKYNSKVFLHPMKNWRLRSHWDESGIQTGGAIQYVWLFGIVGIFVLLLACINFMNLSTARSEKRAKEVGIRKAVGSLRQQIIGQFYFESLLVVAFAFIASLVLTELMLPWFNGIAGKQMSVPFASAMFWIISVAFIFITGIVAGSYPALYLSSFQPVKVLKGTFKTGRFASVPRKTLVVVQFTISLALIISTIIVYNQVQYSKDRPIGYNRDGLMMIQMKAPGFYSQYDIIKNELQSSGAIANMSASSSPVTEIWSSNNGFNWQGKDPSLDAEFSTVWVKDDFGKTVSWQFKEGRDFSRDFVSDSQAVVLNEACVKFMGLKDPVGKILQWGPKNYAIVGVIKDMLMQSPYDPVDKTVYFTTGDNVNWVNIKLNSAKSTSSSIAAIEKIFHQHIPSAPFDYKFADTEFAAKFAAEDRIGTLSTFFAVLAVFISCLGLFGLASFVAEKRTKEIGVRKVLGASVFNLWNLLSKEFVLLVLISFVLAVPLAYYFMHNWLQNYQYRTPIYWWVFAAAGAGILIITLLTVSFQSVKAALANPVKSLRRE